MDKKVKSIIILIIILIVILISLIIILNINNKDEFDNTEKLSEKNENFIETYGHEETGIDVKSYFDIKNCMQIYLSCLNVDSLSYYEYSDDEGYKFVASQDEVNQTIYNVLSKKYISENNITIQNVLNYAPYIQEDSIFVPLEMKFINESGGVKSFLVHGLQEKMGDFSVIKEVYAVMNIDIAQMAFSVEPLKGSYNNLSDVKIDKFEQEISVNENNKFQNSSYNNKVICEDYIDLYKHIALGSPEKMYNLLDKEYREAKFKNLEGFKEYVTKNKDRIYSIRATSYKVNREEGNTQYVCIDQNNHYYIINEKAVLDYSIILDTYTIDLPEFIEKYETSSNEDRVLMNIQRFFSAVEDGDYKYAYNKLDSTFKNNNFKTLEQFEEYVKSNFFASNKLAAGKAEKQGDIYLYKVTISDASEKDNKVITKNFVMKLKENTDFVMSFEVN